MGHLQTDGNLGHAGQEVALIKIFCIRKEVPFYASKADS